MENSQLIFLVFAYGIMLVGIAWIAEQQGHRFSGHRWRPLIYALSIGVYCSSWTFLGAVGQAVDQGWHYLPIYLGPILLIVFGWRLIRRLIQTSAQNKVTSIADFLGSRYGKYQPLAAIVTLVLVIGTLPYIALQLRAVDIAWAAVNWQSTAPLNVEHSTSIYTALIMAWFAIVFGTRVIDGPDRLKGLITVVATESVVKLIAFLVVGLLAWQLLTQANFEQAVPQPNLHSEQFFSARFLTEMLLAACAILCLPRQFHVMVVEYQQPNDLRYARWMVPLYLGLFALMVIPLAQAGSAFLVGLPISSDSYVLTLPGLVSAEHTVALTFIGAISAATGMVVMATVALSIMISNELIVPLWLRFSSHRYENSANLGNSLRLIRRFAVVFVLALSWALERMMHINEGLADIGLVSFAACAQLLPGILAALYWPRAHRSGVIAGLLAGMLIWAYCLLLPLLISQDHSLMLDGFMHLPWLSPQNLFFMGWLDPLSHGVFWSLVVNTLVFILVSRKSALTNLDLRQANAFISNSKWTVDEIQADPSPSGIEVRQLQSLMLPLFGAERCTQIWQGFEHQLGHRLLPHDQAPRFVVHEIERDLAAIIGAVSARRAIKLLVGQEQLALQDFVSLVSGSSRQIQFSQNLLQTTLETIPQGISVVDKDLKLVAWNQQYQELFNYPKRLLYIGCDIQKVYYYNAVRGYLGNDDDHVDVLVEKRMKQLASGKAYRLERMLPNGRVIEIRGTPLDNGGYVTTYTDMSEYHKTLKELEQTKAGLEERVQRRTAQLQSANDSLLQENQVRAKMETQLTKLNEDRGRFIAAASHDLLQPINAARLFTSSLISQVEGNDDPKLKPVVQQLDDALSQIEQLINSLREISRLRSGKEQPKRNHFSASEFLKSLAAEAGVLAENKGLEFRCIDCSSWLFSDGPLLRRVVQNFISNALRYTQQGKVILGVRRKQDGLCIEVWDTGPGISEQDQQKIFEEFERLPGSSAQGLGLGLSIAKNISQLLGHKIEMDSWLGKGSVFRVYVPYGEKQQQQVKKVHPDPNLNNVPVLVIDNESSIQAGMQALLEQWGCVVRTAGDLNQALSVWSDEQPPRIILADYHLDTETGLEVLEALRYHWQHEVPAIVISADNSEDVRGQVLETGNWFLAKPVKANALRTTMHRVLRQTAG
jgi:Na+/proline symporter/signal transduction histidine kinase/CheY-like chemotaxis protein